MRPPRSTVTHVSGIICTIVGMVATVRYGVSLFSGSINAVDYDPLLLPLGIVLLQGNRLWMWLARIHLFLMALISSATILVFLLMSEESRSITFELHDNVGRISGGGLILLTQAILLGAILWIHFAIFSQPFQRTDPEFPLP